MCDFSQVYPMFFSFIKVSNHSTKNKPRNLLRLCFWVFFRYKEAEEDCTKAISLDSTYSKAFARRATARVTLGKLEEAKQGAAQRNTVLPRQHFVSFHNTKTTIYILFIVIYNCFHLCLCCYYSTKGHLAAQSNEWKCSSVKSTDLMMNTDVVTG